MPLKIAVLGPSGQCGSTIVSELLSRGHSVTGLSRNPPAVWPSSSSSSEISSPETSAGTYTAVSVDLHDTSALAAAFSANLDGIVVCYAPALGDLGAAYEAGVEAHARIKTALLRSSHSGGFVVVGGGGSLTYRDGRQLVDQPGFMGSWWRAWPDEHLRYMQRRMGEHGARGVAWLVWGIRWARGLGGEFLLYDIKRDGLS